jgi:tetratricopeptide (TPR) repeat protein
MIVRDSARTLPACLESIRPWVDETVVVDTGSRDDTRDIARRFGARVSDFPWVDDFSAARNESLRLATGEWLFWMDSDDTIDAANGRQLQTLARSESASNVLGYVIQVHCPVPDEDGMQHTIAVDHVKLVRNDPGIRFEGRIHEQLLPSIRRLGGQVAWSDLFVVHSGAETTLEGRRRKADRDLRLLNLELAERPDHPFVLFNLGMTYQELGEHDSAESWLRRCISVSDPRESHVRKAYALLADCLFKLSRTEESRATCDQGLALYPGDEELRFRHAVLAQNRGDLEEAIRVYRSILDGRESRHFQSVDLGIHGYKALHNLALAYAERGDRQLAEVQYRESLARAPLFRSAWRGLAEVLVAQEKYTSAELLAEGDNGVSVPPCDRLWLYAEIALRRGSSSRVT